MEQSDDAAQCEKISSMDALWADVEPLFQEDAAVGTLISINYDPQIKKAFDLFRRICENEEFSDRGLHLSTEVIEYNPANYSAWIYRRKCLLAINANILEEHKYTREIIENHPKAYQVWYHYRCIMDILNDGSEEMEFVEQLLLEDAKNLNIWSYCLWIGERFNLWDEQAQMIRFFLKMDIRNNSVWNYRQFLVKKRFPLTLSFLEEELSTTLHIIELAPQNECPYNFLRFLIKEISIHQFQRIPSLRIEIKEKLQAMVSEVPNCRFSWEILASLSKEDHQYEEAKKIYTKLAIMDPIRHKYWQWMKHLCGSSSSIE